MHTTRHTPCTHRRRGTGIAAVILLLAVMNIAAISVIRSGTDESEAALLRAHTLQAYYAAESAAVIAVKHAKQPLTMPTAGTTLTIGAATARFNTVPGSSGGTLEVSGEAGNAKREVRVVFQVQ